MATKSDGFDQARGWSRNIRRMVENLTQDTLDELLESPLGIETRSDWVTYGEVFEPAEYRIYLCAGGPAVRLTGEMDIGGCPESVIMEYLDSFTPWMEYLLDENEEEDCLTYARQFFV